MLELFGNKYYHVFTSGNYPQGSITNEMLMRCASAYDIKFHEAPLWIGHLKPDETFVGNDEPKALGWTKTLLFADGKLYVEFSHLSEEAIYLIEEQKFKYVSCEFVWFDIGGVKTLYLYAIALTNRPAVNGLEPLSLPKQFTDHNFKKDMGERLTFELVNNSFNLNINTMNQSLLDIAKSMGLDVTKFTNDQSLTDAMKTQYANTASKITSFTSQIDTLTTEVNTLKAKKTTEPPAPGTESDEKTKQFTARIESLESMLFTSLVDGAIKDGKVLPAQRDNILEYAKKDYEGCKRLIDATPVNALFTSKTVKDTTAPLVDLQNPKFTLDGKTLTYSKVISDPELLKKFNDDELLALKENESK